MRGKDKGRFGPWEPMQGALGRALSMQNEASVARDEPKRRVVKDPSKLKAGQLKGAQRLARKGITRGSSPQGADR